MRRKPETAARPVMGVIAPAPRLTWQAAAVLALALALPGGALVHLFWG